jgi:hypothetical protein
MLYILFTILVLLGFFAFNTNAFTNVFFDTIEFIYDKLNKLKNHISL